MDERDIGNRDDSAKGNPRETPGFAHDSAVTASGAALVTRGAGSASPDAASLQAIAAATAGYHANALRVDVARAVIARLVQRVDGIERVPLRAALGRVLADDVVSPIDVPPHDNAAMDGYAFVHADLAADGDTRLAVIGRGLAGDAFHGVIGAMQCVRITTGAVMPPGLDTVVPQELVTRSVDTAMPAHAPPPSLDSASRSSAAPLPSATSPAASPTHFEHITIPAHAVRAGDHRRRAGEDLARGGVALRAGRVLKPSDLGLLASLGHVDAIVRRRLRVAIFTTGSELRSAGVALDAGAVYDSNRHTLTGMLERIGVDVIDLGVVRDEPRALTTAFASAAASADAVVTSGGVSGGEADHTRAAIDELGDVLFWGLAMRPGRPMAIGRIASAGGHALLFGLPGNPVAVMVTFYALVRDAMLAMAGATEVARLAWPAISTSAIRKKPGRTEYLRGIVSAGRSGQLEVRLTGSQGSGILRSMSEANALVVLGHDRGDVNVGDVVDVWPFDGLV